MNGQYEVLSPWAEVDPMPLKGISPRITDLTGKKIGLYYNPKRAGKPMLEVVERKLRERFTAVGFSRFNIEVNECIVDTVYKARWEEWLKEVDAVILSYGD
jgi:hypothetical protein